MKFCFWNMDLEYKFQNKSARGKILKILEYEIFQEYSKTIVHQQKIWKF